MLDVMYQVARTRADRIKREIGELERFSVPAGKWHERSFESVGGVVAGVDGSMNILAFEDIALYAVSSTAVINTENMISSQEHGDINIMPVHPFMRERVRVQMMIYELKAGLAALALKEGGLDWLLLDGSFQSYLIQPAAFERRPSKDVREELVETYFSRLRRQDFTQVSLAVNEFKDEIDQRYRKQNFEVLTFLEYLEYLAVLAHLLEEHRNTAAVSKTSSSHTIFENVLPDAAIFDRASLRDGTPREGCSSPEKVAVDTTVKRGFPVLNSFFKSLKFNLIYARMQDRGPMLRVETASNHLEELLGAVKRECVEGYPFILKKAHQDVVIKNMDMQTIWNSLGEFRKPIRGMLA